MADEGARSAIGLAALSILGLPIPLFALIVAIVALIVALYALHRVEHVVRIVTEEADGQAEVIHDLAAADPLDGGGGPGDA